MKFNDNEIVNMYINGYNMAQIAKYYNTYNTTIRRILIRNNIQTRSISETWSKRSNPFIDITNDEVQYWLGLLATDGNVSKGNNNRIVLQLHWNDRYIVEAFAKFTNATAYNVYNKKYNLYEKRVAFRNKQIKSTLVSYGIVPCKSKILKMNIPITFSFLRGVIDGDGYIRKYNNRSTVEIATASNLFALQLYEFLSSNNIKCTIREDKNKLYIVGVYSKLYSLTLYKKLYEKASIFMIRKKNRFGLPYEEIQLDTKSSNSGNML